MQEIYANKTMNSKYQQKTFQSVRYQMITVYEECTSKSEGTDDITAALNAAAIYLSDPDCIAIKIYDNARGEWVMDYWR